MTFAVKDIFYTLQGEGVNAGRPAVFLRFAGCNLWSGREEDRADATCAFCDTDFVGAPDAGGGSFADARALAESVAARWPKDGGIRRFVVCTGGEPLLQMTSELTDALHAHGFEIAVETNGTQACPAGVDWLTVSPKAGAPLVLKAGDELKLIYPQDGAPPEDFASLAFAHFLLQPMDGPEIVRNTKLALDYCLAHPPWRLGLQTHKFLGIP
ncbi:MAG: 7-carboxy-7-deazaguanine synthase [Pseudomonadota bacterium]